MRDYVRRLLLGDGYEVEVGRRRSRSARGRAASDAGSGARRRDDAQAQRLRVAGRCPRRPGSACNAACCCCPRARVRRHASRDSTPVPTTTSRNRSRHASSWYGSAARCRHAGCGVRRSARCAKKRTRSTSSTGSASPLPANWTSGRAVQTVTDAATELTGAEFGSFFYNVVDAVGEKYMLYAISGVPREVVREVPDAAQHGGVRADLRGHRRRAFRRHHAGRALRPQRSASWDAEGALAGAQLSRGAGHVAIGRRARRPVLRPSSAPVCSPIARSGSRSASPRRPRPPSTMRGSMSRAGGRRMS